MGLKEKGFSDGFFLRLKIDAAPHYRQRTLLAAEADCKLRPTVSHESIEDTRLFSCLFQRTKQF